MMCLGLRGFLGFGNLSAKTEQALSKYKRIRHPTCNSRGNKGIFPMDEVEKSFGGPSLAGPGLYVYSWTNLDHDQEDGASTQD